MDILDKIELYLGEEISGTPAPDGGSPGTTTGKVAKFVGRSNIINRKKKKSDDEDSEEEVSKRNKERQVKSGSAAINGLGSKTVTGGLGSKL